MPPCRPTQLSRFYSPTFLHLHTEIIETMEADREGGQTSTPADEPRVVETTIQRACTQIKIIPRLKTL